MFGLLLPGTLSSLRSTLYFYISSIAFITFCTQTYLTMKDYFTFRTIIEMQLKFEPGKLDLSVDFLKGFGF